MPKKRLEPSYNPRKKGGAGKSLEPAYRPPEKKEKEGKVVPETKDNKLVQLLTRLARLKDDKTSLESELTEVHKDIELGVKEAAEYMDKRRVQNVRIKGLGVFFRSDRPFASKIAGLEAKLFAELKLRGYGSAVKLDVNSNTLSSIAAELKEKNEKPLKWATTFDKKQVGYRREGGARTETGKK